MGLKRGPDWRLRSEFLTLIPPPHGGATDPSFLDFSANINPYGPPPSVLEAIYCIPLDRYPDSGSYELRSVLSAKLGISEGSILVGNGSVELIRLVTFACLHPGDRVIVVEPTFSEYAFAAKLMGARIQPFLTLSSSGFSLDIEELCRFIRSFEPRLTFLCNPDNPTGRYLGEREVRMIAEACSSGFLVLDEAFVNFVDKPWSSLSLLGTGNVIILRSLTKDYALAGLRLGYLLGPDDLVDVLSRIQPPWSVNIFAQRLGVAALAADDYLRDTMGRILLAKARLRQELNAIGLEPLPSSVHFFLLEVGEASRLCAILKDRGIFIRDCTSFGLPSFVRISTRTQEENCRLIEVLKEIPFQFKQRGNGIRKGRGRTRDIP